MMSQYVTTLADVSIHAPARGATRNPDLSGQTLNVSIHAPARGATLLSPVCVLGDVVSIHAPARGATLLLQEPLKMAVFQFTHPRGVRQIRNSWGYGYGQFQFTHPRGVRPFGKLLI